MSQVDVVSKVLAPSEVAGSFTASERLSGTTGEDSNTTALPVRQMATIIVGDQAIRAVFSDAAATVATTSMVIPANGRFDWFVTDETTFISIESEDATTAYEAWVWSSSPRQ